MSEAHAVAALAQRLRAGVQAATGTLLDVSGDAARDADTAMEVLVERLRATRDTRLAWLLLTLTAGAYPTAAAVRRLVRSAALDDAVTLRLQLLDDAHVLARAAGSRTREAVVERRVVVDVDSVAQSDFHNGIQRTVREVVRAWHAQGQEVVLAAWTPRAGSLRTLTADEEHRVARWGQEPVALDPTSTEPALVVPWETTIVLGEVPLADRCERLAPLAEVSGNRVVGIGYDAIPVLSADLRPLGEPNGYAAYLTVVKHAARIAAISASAGEEFAGFVDALAAQGLPGPAVDVVPLPVTVPAPPAGYVRPEPARPLVVSLGRLEPHKNQGALLHAALRLWREGHDFELHLVGGPGWDTARVERQLERARAEDRPLTWHRTVDDDELWRMLRDASFTVFLSLHEGFGLPVAESLACGTPVLTTRYGSQAEIAAAGGCLTVDPRDDEAVHAGLHRMLTEPQLLTTLRQEAAAVPRSTWDGYAARLWDALLEGDAR